MADTTIKVSTEVRDRLAVLAAERGTTIRDLVEQLSTITPTQAELQERQIQAIEYMRAHLRADFGPEDVAAGEQIWQNLHAGRLPGHDGPSTGQTKGGGGRAA